MDLLTTALIGAAVGIVTGLIPGLHVNTLAALGLATAASPGAGLLLVAAGTVHTIVNIVPATYLGVPDDDDALVLLPAHRLLHAGRGPEAISTSVAASLIAVIAAVTLVPAYEWLLFGPIEGLHRLEQGAPWIIGAVIVWLVASERRRGARAIAWAAGVFIAASWLGWIAGGVPMRGVLPGANPLLPLLGGLFGLAGLLVAWRAQAAIPLQDPPRTARTPARTLLPAIGISGVTAVLPGLTAAVATSLLPRQDEPRRAVAALSAVNSAHAVLALAVLFLVGAVRSGLADAVDRTTPLALWAHGPSAAVADVLAVVLVAAAVGALGTLALGRGVARWVHRMPNRSLTVVGMLLIITIVALLTGAGGLLVLAAATALGIVPVRAGIRRVHLTGCLLGPIVIRLWA